MSRAFRIVGLFAAVLLVPAAAEACSVCFDTSEENRVAFIATTVFLSIAPLALLFGIGSWVKRRVLEGERRHEAARERAVGANRS